MKALCWKFFRTRVRLPPPPPYKSSMNTAPLARGFIFLCPICDTHFVWPKLLGILPVALAGATLWMLLTQHFLWSVAFAMIAWGTIHSAIPVAWSTWLSPVVSDEPESAGGWLIGSIQLAIMCGGALGGYLLDHTSITGTFLGGSVLLLLSACVVGNGYRLSPPYKYEILAR